MSAWYEIVIEGKEEDVRDLLPPQPPVAGSRSGGQRRLRHERHRPLRRCGVCRLGSRRRERGRAPRCHHRCQIRRAAWPTQLRPELRRFQSAASSPAPEVRCVALPRGDEAPPPWSPSPPRAPARALLRRPAPGVHPGDRHARLQVSRGRVRGHPRRVAIVAPAHACGIDAPHPRTDRSGIAGHPVRQGGSRRALTRLTGAP